MSTEATLTGGCRCRAVRYEIIGESFMVQHCHCLSCRRHNGAPEVTLAGFKVSQVEYSGEEWMV